MADRQFVVGGQASAPAIWTLAAALEIVPKIAYASFNGAASSGAYLPCLRLISDSGHVAVEAVADTTVAQGGSADVSWFRGMKPPCPPNGWPNTNASTTVLAFGPWAFWKMNEPLGSTTNADSSGHSRTLSVNTVQVSEGKKGLVPTSSDTCAYVTWTSATNVFSFVSVSTQAWNSAVVSLEYWINAIAHPSNELNLGCMGSITSASTRNFRLFLNSSGQIQFEYFGTDAALHTFTFAAGVFDLNPHHVVVVLDGTNITCYLDGAQADQQAQPVAMRTALTALVYVGQPGGGAGSRSYNGYMGHVAWYDKILTAANVLSLYNAGTKIS